MFSRIGDFLKPAGGVAKDTQQQPQVQADKKRQGSGGDHAPPAQTEDDTLFSIAAIRALLQAQPVMPEDQTAHDEILGKLTQLEQQGIMSIPVALNQSIYEAVRFAVAAVK